MNICGDKIELRPARESAINNDKLVSIIITK